MKRQTTKPRRGRPPRELKNGDTVRCCICHFNIEPKRGWTLGNNAEPLAHGRCCDHCNQLVIAHRLGMYRAADLLRSIATNSEKSK